MPRLLSMYFSGSGFYITTSLTIQAVLFLALALLTIALCGAELFEYTYEAGPQDLKLSHRRLQEAVTPILGVIAGDRVDVATDTDVQQTITARPTPLRPHQLALSDGTVGTLNGTSNDLGVTSSQGAVYSAAYILQLGFVMMLPYVMELWVELGLWRSLLTSAKLFAGGSMIFSLFAMQTKAYYFSNALNFGRASYVATGRGFQIEVVSFVDLYGRYAQSHIYTGFELAIYLMIFQLISVQPAQAVWLATASVSRTLFFDCLPAVARRQLLATIRTRACLRAQSTALHTHKLTGSWNARSPHRRWCWWPRSLSRHGSSTRGRSRARRSQPRFRSGCCGSTALATPSRSHRARGTSGTRSASR